MPQIIISSAEFGEEKFDYNTIEEAWAVFNHLKQCQTEILEEFDEGETFDEIYNEKGHLHNTKGPARIGSRGTEEWYVNGKPHREDGPAITRANNKEWYTNGKLHREDGPAIECADGHKDWYVNGKLHREDGPAREWADGRKEWWANGKLLVTQNRPRRI